MAKSPENWGKTNLPQGWGKKQSTVSPVSEEIKKVPPSPESSKGDLPSVTESAIKVESKVTDVTDSTKSVRSDTAGKGHHEQQSTPEKRDEKTEKSNNLLEDVKKEKNPLNKKFLIAVIGVVIVIGVAALGIYFIMDAKNESGAEETPSIESLASSTPTASPAFSMPASTPTLTPTPTVENSNTENMTSKPSVEQEKVKNINDYVGCWHIDDSEEKELVIYSAVDEKITFTLWYYRLASIDEVVAELDGNVATFSYSDYSEVSGTLTFADSVVIVNITQSNMTYMPVETLIFNNQNDLSCFSSELQSGGPEDGNQEIPSVDMQLPSEETAITLLYDLENQENEDFYSYRVPQINCETPDVVRINSQIAEDYGSIVEEEMVYISEGFSTACYEIDYTTIWTDNTLTLTIFTNDSGCYPSYRVYNIDRITGNEITGSAMIEKAGMTEEVFTSRVKQKTIDYFTTLYEGQNWAEDELVEEARQSLISYYNEYYISTEMPMFFNAYGQLCVIATIPCLAGPEEQEVFIIVD